MSVNITMQDSFETVGEKMKILVSEQPALRARLETQLAKLDKLDGLKAKIDEAMAEVLISRRERERRQRGKQS